MHKDSTQALNLGVRAGITFELIFIPHNIVNKHNVGRFAQGPWVMQCEILLWLFNKTVLAGVEVNLYIFSQPVRQNRQKSLFVFKT